jgi:fumarate hydratase subunit alpha
MSISGDVIQEVTANLYEKACKSIPVEVEEALRTASETDSSEVARLQLKQMLENVKAAREDNNVVCQDLGIPCFFVKYGTQARFDGDLNEAIGLGLKRLFVERPNIMTVQTDTLEWKPNASWLGVHSPFVHVDLLPDADYIEILAFPKGNGSAMWGKLAMDEMNKANIDDIKKFVLDALLEAGPQACPPYIIGVGLGGTFDYVCHLAKIATVRPINTSNPDPRIAEMEEELLEAINATGIGVMGLGGDTTALAVNMEYASTHFYRTPMAFELNCWISRQKTARVYMGGKVEYLDS